MLVKKKKEKEAKWATFQPYHGEKQVTLMRWGLFVLDQHA